MPAILVVDDEPGVAEVLEALLLDRGYAVHVASDGRDGLLALHTGLGFDAVLLDYMMPVMDGVAMLRTMQTDLAVAGAPVMFMVSLPEAAIQSQVSGYAGFLRKPFGVQAVLAMSNGVMRR